MLKTAIKHSFITSIFSLAALATSSIAFAEAHSPTTLGGGALTSQTGSTPKNAGSGGGDSIVGGMTAPIGDFACPINLCFQSNIPGDTSCHDGRPFLVIVQTTEEYCDAHGYNSLDPFS